MEVIEFVNFPVMHVLKCNLGRAGGGAGGGIPVVCALVFVSTGPGFGPARVILMRYCV